MSDRKYECRDGGLWHREGKYMVPADEPLMTLRAKDPDSLAAINGYLLYLSDVCTATGDPEAIAHFEGAKQTLEEFKKFQREHPERVKRGCHKPDTCGGR